MRIRTCPSLMLRAVAAGVLALTRARAAEAQSAAPVVLDGVFGEWEGVPAAVTDPADAPHPFADIREVRVRDDAEGVYLLLTLERGAALQSLPGTLQLLLDTDGDTASGWEEAGMRGVDAVLEFSPRGPGGAFAGVMLRAVPRPGARPEEFAASGAGVVMAPSLASSRFEVRMDRGAPLRFGARFSARLVSRDRDGAVVDQTAVFSATLSSGAARPTPSGHGTADPLARAPGTDFRLLSWNVGRRDLREGTVEFGALLRAVQPDMIMLDEVDGFESATQVLAVLNRILPGGQPWRAVLGTSGGTQRGVVAVRGTVTVAAPFAGHVAYPDSAATLVPRDAPASAHEAAARRASEGVPTVGAVAEIGGRLLAVTVDLECCGNPDSFSDRLRRVEAAVLRDRIREVLRGGGVDAVIVAGDFNLVGSRTPLETVARGTDVDASSLAIAEPLRLNGASVATWERPDDRFTPGRLDYVLAGDAALTIVRSFPFNSGDLSPEWRAHHGLDAETSHRATDHLPIVTDLRWAGR